MRTIARTAAALALVAACSPAAPPAAVSTPAAPAVAPPPPSAPPRDGNPVPATPVLPEAPPAPAAAENPPLVPADQIADVLYPEGLPATLATTCPATQADPQRVACMLRARYEGHDEEAATAVRLYESARHVMGVERAWVMDGGFRGTIQIVPELPVGRHKRHLDWVAGGLEEIDGFFAGIGARAPRPIAYRWRGLAFRWLRSVGRTTPSAYAEGWTVGWNVMGSLHRSADKVRETLFHELFHLNDAAHGDWSRANLAALHQQIVARCGTNRACLQPWAPSETTVRGGTYYAFQPDNGDAFHEYGAELALRWYREQRAALAGARLPGRSFKCGPEPNARVWTLLADEFFGGVDLVPACSP